MEIVKNKFFEMYSILNYKMMKLKLHYLAELFCAIYLHINLEEWDCDAREFTEFKKKIKEFRKIRKSNKLSSMWTRNYQNPNTSLVV